MTKYHTNNALGSTDPRDLYDNAQNLDSAVNDTENDTWKDRFGRERVTLKGYDTAFQNFLINSGYQNIGDYGPGLEITARNQIFWRDGELYRAGASLELPYTTTGDWGTEEGLFVAVGDQSLRQDLESHNQGAALIGRGVVAVDSIADLLALPEEQRREDLRYLVRGYHAGSNVGGGEFYFDSARTGENDGGVVLEGFVRVSDGGMFTPQMFGARGDGGDETETIRSAINAGDVFIPDGLYLFNVDTRISVPSNRTIEFSNNAVIKAMPSASGNHAIFQLTNAENVKFISPQIIGERYEHLGVDGEGGMGIRILSSKNVSIIGGYASEFWGDGLYIGAFDSEVHQNCENVTVDGFTSFDNRRQGISITGLTRGFIRNCVFRDIGGIAPGAGIDIEPNGDFYVKDIFVENTVSYDCVYGFAILNVSQSEQGKEANGDVVLSNCYSYGSTTYGYEVNGVNTKFANCSAEEGGSGFVVRNARAQLISPISANNTGVGLTVDETASALVQSPMIYNNTNGIGAYGILEVYGGEIKNNSSHGITSLQSASNAAIVLMNVHIHSNASGGSGSNVIVSGIDSLYIRGCVIKKGTNENKPEYGIRVTSTTKVRIYDNDLLEGGTSDPIFKIGNLPDAIICHNKFDEAGTYGNRPLYPLVGTVYFNTESGKPIYWEGANWVNADGTLVT